MKHMTIVSSSKMFAVGALAAALFAIAWPTTAQSTFTLSATSLSQGERLTISGPFTDTGNSIEFKGTADSLRIDVGRSYYNQSISLNTPGLTPGIYQVVVTTGTGSTSTAGSLTITLNPYGPVPTPVIPSPVVTPQPTSVPLPTPCIFDRILCQQTYVYVALGDSVAVGLSATQGYVRRYEERVEQAHPGAVLKVENFAQNGLTSTGLDQMLATDQTVRAAILAADIVTWNIGGNDLRAAREKYRARTCGGLDNQDCLRLATSKLQQNYTEIVTSIVGLRQTSSGLTRSMDLYYPYVAEDLASDTWQGDGGATDLDELLPYLQQVNAHIRQELSRYGIGFASVATRFNGADGRVDPAALGYISFDGFHPNDNGHVVIAQELASLGYAGLKPVPASAPVPTPLPIPSFPPLPTIPPSLLPQPCSPWWSLFPCGFIFPTIEIPDIFLPKPCIRCAEL